MGIDFYLMTELLKLYGPQLEKLYIEDIEKFKSIFKETEKTFQAGMKLLSGRQLTSELINRKLSLDLMAEVNAKMRSIKYFEESKDTLPVFLRGEEEEKA